ncbi:hypothetical protein ES703_50597 [subsurface metagenome]
MEPAFGVVTAKITCTVGAVIVPDGPHDDFSTAIFGEEGTKDEAIDILSCFNNDVMVDPCVDVDVVAIVIGVSGVVEVGAGQARLKSVEVGLNPVFLCDGELL